MSELSQMVTARGWLEAMLASISDAVIRTGT